MTRLQPPVVRLLQRRVFRQAARFLIIGVGSTALTSALYLVLRGWLSATVANVIAVAATTVLSSIANRKITFSDVARVSPLRMGLQGVLVFLFYCTSTSLALNLVNLVVAHPTAMQQAAAMVVVSTLGGTARFLILRVWVFARSARGNDGRTRPPEERRT